MTRPLRRALFWLAQDLGMPVREVERRVDSAEIAEWLAFWRIEPRFSPWQAMAQICCIVYNAFRGKGQAKHPRDFLPAGMAVKRQSSAQQRAAFGAWAAIHNARIKAQA